MCSRHRGTDRGTDQNTVAFEIRSPNLASSPWIRDAPGKNAADQIACEDVEAVAKAMLFAG